MKHIKDIKDIKDISIMACSFGIAMAVLLFAVSTPAEATITYRMSNISGSGIPGVAGNFFSSHSSTSADGKKVAFASDATNLDPTSLDTNQVTDIFVHDRTTGTTTRVSVDSAGVQATGGGSRNPSISPDGTLVAFESDATNLVAGDTNGLTDIFVHNLLTGATTRVSVDSFGAEAVGGGAGGGSSILPSIQGTGFSFGFYVVAFQSGATNLDTPILDTNGVDDIYLYDSSSVATTFRVTWGLLGAEANGHSMNPSLAMKGVAYESDASNLVPGDTNAVTDIFISYEFGGITRESEDSTGAQANGPSFSPSLADDNFVAYSSLATNLVPGDANGVEDIFIHTPGGASILVSVDQAGIQGNGPSQAPAISAAPMWQLGVIGHRVAFHSAATNLVGTDTNGVVPDIFVKTPDTGVILLVSLDDTGLVQGPLFSLFPSISRYGKHIAFDSASIHVPGDGNTVSDVFINDRNSTVCRGRIPTIAGTTGHDVISGTPGDDVIQGYNGNDTIDDGGGGNDVICGGYGHDTITLTSGNNLVWTGWGKDIVIGGSGNDIISASTTGQHKELSGGGGFDVIFGGYHSDILDGGAGNDYLYGSTGPDTCDGGPGTDKAFACEILISIP